MNLLVISHTPHYRNGSQIAGWGPTVKEIDQLAKLFDQIYHVAVLYEDHAPPSSLPYAAANVKFIPVHPSGGDTLMAKLGVIHAYISYIKVIRREISKLGDGDIIHVRCPSNISLLAVSFLIFTRKAPLRWIKYAGNWQPGKNEPCTYGLQRWMLKLNVSRSLITINGRWLHQPKHIVSFYNPSLFVKDTRAMAGRPFSAPFRLLFVGNINESKGADRAVEIALRLLASGIDIEMDIIGDGELRAELEKRVGQLKQEKHFHFHGWQSHEDILPFYKQGHFVLLPSRTEGWPKVLSEAMAYGVVPLAGAVSAIPQILEECKTGMALDPLNLQGFVDAIRTYIDNPQRWAVESRAAQAAVEQFTYEAYLENLTAMFAQKWQLKL